MTTLEATRNLIGEVLQLGERTARLEASTALLGSLPELDSMSAAYLIAALEERFAIVIDDDDLSEEVFQTVGTLHEFVERKLAG